MDSNEDEKLANPAGTHYTRLFYALLREVFAL